MTPGPVQVVDSLSLLALKVASNVFDLSSRMHHVSIRDQIVRGQMVVRDLKRGDDQLDSLLIVGAGVAGMSAALTAAEMGLKHVVVVEVAKRPFSLLHGVTARYVGPFMYEWPSPFHDDQSFPTHARAGWSGRAVSPLSWKSKRPCSADQLAAMLTSDVQGRLLSIASRGLVAPTICVGEDPVWIANYVRSFARAEAARALARLQGHDPVPPIPVFGYYNSITWPSGNPAQATLTPQYVLLAAGMGQEDRSLLRGNPVFTGKKFWENDDLLDPDTANRSISVFGGGDGALQDMLRALTGHAHPLMLIDFLQASPQVKNALRRVTPELLSADRQGRQFSTWTQARGEYESVDACCQRLAKDLARNARVVRRVGQALRFGRGQVTQFVRGEFFDKAYLLNRFLVHLVEACAVTRPSSWSGRMRVAVLRQHQATSYLPLGARHVVEIERLTDKHRFDHESDRVVVRYGIEKGSIPGAQMIQVSPQESQQRTTLARVELPFVTE